MVVDTAPLVYLLEGHLQFAPLFDGLFHLTEKGEIEIAVSTITVAEVLVGPLQNGKDTLAKRDEKALHPFQVVPVTTEIAVTAARLRGATGIRLPDAIQAATALEIAAAALVTDDRDFSKLTGLKVCWRVEGGARPPSIIKSPAESSICARFSPGATALP